MPSYVKHFRLSKLVDFVRYLWSSILLTVNLVLVSGTSRISPSPDRSRSVNSLVWCKSEFVRRVVCTLCVCDFSVFFVANELLIQQFIVNVELMVFV